MRIFYFVIGFIAAVLIVYLLMKRVRQEAGDDFSGNPINPEQIKKRQEGLAKIETLARHRGRISNNDVQRALKVSDATATRYLDYLVNLGKLVQVGQRGQSVYYQTP